MGGNGGLAPGVDAIPAIADGDVVDLDVRKGFFGGGETDAGGAAVADFERADADVTLAGKVDDGEGASDVEADMVGVLVFGEFHVNVLVVAENASPRGATLSPLRLA